ncbi:MAG: RDD family protein [Bryobacteraceae bacterium]
MLWFYAEGEVQKGPVSDEAFADLVRSGVVRDSTLIWREDLPNWTPYSSVKVPVAAPPVPPAPSFAPVAAAAAAAPVQFCTNCGRQFLSSELVAIYGRPVCAQCKPQVLQQVREGATPMDARVYAGFWARFAAILIDGIILTIVTGGLTMVVFAAGMGGDPSSPAWIGAFALLQLVDVAIGVGYVAWFLVNKGATPGKMALGLRVIRANGGPITYGLGVGRYFASMVSGMILGLGYLMAIWDPEKRTLHDRICDTRVIKG